MFQERGFFTYKECTRRAEGLPFGAGLHLRGKSC